MLSLAALCPAARAAVTARSYVQKGLAVQYDGLDNAGHGTHDGAAATWKDLTGNGYDGVVGANVTWAADGWVNDADGQPITVLPKLAALTGTGLFTMQFTCTPTRDDARESFFGQYGGAVADSLCIEHNSSTGAKEGGIRLFRNYSAGGKLNQVNYLSSTAKIAANAWTAASVVVTPTSQTIWLNGALADTRTGAFAAPNSSCTSVIGGDPTDSRKEFAFHGKYNAFRLYTRALSAEETAVNAAVDAIRFNGASPADFTLGGGYSFDADGNLCVDIAAAAGAAGGGTVSANGGAAGASASVAVGQHDATATTLAAVAASGYVFSRWDGDVDAIVSGSRYSAEIAVSAKWPVALTAVFKPAALDAYAYVQDGLVAAYDGLDNAGTGMHDASATTWKDLTGNGNDGVCDARLAWDANGWRVSGDCKPVTVGPAIANTLATANFTMQFACTPSAASAGKRMCYFGQYNGNSVASYPGRVNVEQTAGGKLRLYRFGNAATADTSDWTSGAGIAAGAFSSVALTVSPALSVAASRSAFHVGGALGDATTAKAFGQATNGIDSVIGGEAQETGKRTGSAYVSGYGIAFSGTYHAFRLYNRVLSRSEIAWNAAVDAVRFGAGAPAGYALDGDGLLYAEVSATATKGGKVRCNGGAAAASAAGTASNVRGAALSAVPDFGYVFDRWTGDVDCIAEGTLLTPEITLGPGAAALTAVFRPNGDAADGLVFDLDVKGDLDGDGLIGAGEVGNGLMADAANAADYYKTTATKSDAYAVPGYVSAEIAPPVFPCTTNAATTCLYLPQQEVDGTKVFRTRVDIADGAATGRVSTVFCRFRWDGPVVPAYDSYAALVFNGYKGWTYIGQGFLVRIRASADDATKGYPQLVIPKQVAKHSEDSAIAAGTWTDLFASVYPSPTNPALSNGDIWFCNTPTIGSSGDFTDPVLSHVHFGDDAELPLMDTTAAAMAFGAEGTSTALADRALGGGTSTDAQAASKCFRGAIASVKAWTRLLTTNEMFTVMAGFGGAASFDASSAAGRRWGVESGMRQEGHGVYASAFVGDATRAHVRRSLTTTYNALTFVFNAPADGWERSAYVYTASISGAKAGNAHPIHLELNGETMWAAGNVAAGDEIAVDIAAGEARPGLNELKWVYDTPVANNWLTFAAHRLALVPPPNGTVLIFR